MYTLNAIKEFGKHTRQGQFDALISEHEGMLIIKDLIKILRKLQALYK